MLEDENKQLETNEAPEGVDKTNDVAEEIKDFESFYWLIVKCKEIIKIEDE